MTARATLHRLNFRELPRLVDHAKAMALDGISFLPADMSSGRPSAGSRCRRRASLALEPRRDRRVRDDRRATIADYAATSRRGFIAESPDKLRRLPRYYAALGGTAPFPRVACNAPWVSVVIEADGRVRPCFFHHAVGSVRRTPLETIVTRQPAGVPGEG